jgi:pyridinium-3,5-bisthiocarboxylic acid mononucleotide nickel chelatase
MSRRSSTGSEQAAAKRTRAARRSRAESTSRPAAKRTRAARRSRAESTSRPAAKRTRAARRSRAESTQALLANRVPDLLHLDAFSGIAGNMFLAALLDLGLPRRVLEEDLAGLDVPFRLRVSRVHRGPLAARYLRVIAPGSGRGRAASHGHGRRWSEIRRLIGRARLAPSVRDRALAIFEALAGAEARVHGIPIERVHFHEVGAVDAIVDIVGAAVALHRLGIRQVTCTPLPLGHGSVETEHGRLPLPAPATLELLRGIPVTPAPVAWETVTPTGAAIARCVVDEFRTLPAMTPETVGIGAGDDRPGELPNVLRAVLGRSGGWGGDRVACLETHLDDLNPEHFDHLMERLFEAGALDVSLQHLQMKKNRPGFGLRAIARPDRVQALAAVIFAESTTLGVRVAESERLVLEREERRVATPFGPIRVKIARDGEGRTQPSAEYDDCKRAARRAGVPLREVVRAAEEAARGVGSTSGGAGGRR